MSFNHGEETDITGVRNIRKEAKKVFSRLGMAYFLFLAATSIFQVMIICIAKWTGTAEALKSENRRIVLSMISMYGIGFPVFWMMVRKMVTGYGNSEFLAEGESGSFCIEGLEKEKWGILPLFITFLIAVGVMEVGNFIGNGLMNAMSRKLGTEMVNDVFTLIMQGNRMIMILFAVIIGPVMEELMFRKILIDRIIRFGEVRAAIVSGVLFGLVHGNFYQFFYAFGLGMVFAYVYIRTGKLRFTIGMHMVINGMSAIIAGGLMKNIEYGQFMELSQAGNLSGAMAVLGSHWFSYALLILYSLGMLAAAFAGIILLICVCIQKKIHFLPSAVTIPGRFTYMPVFLNVGMFLFFVSCVVQFLMM